MIFVHLIELATPVNISIYQRYDENLLRQKILCEIPRCTISEDEYSLTIKLDDVTFNVPNATYYVEINDNFLRYKDQDVMIPGVKLGNWIIQMTEGKSI